MHNELSRIPAGLDVLWGAPRAATRGPAAKHSVRDVAAAGVGLADSEGLGGVTLSSVATSLGLTTTALYRYVDTKDVLLDLMADLALGEPPELAESDWRAAAYAWSTALHATYVEHPWLSTMPATGMPRRPGVYAWLDRLAGAVEGPIADPLGLALTLDALVRGFAGIRPGDADTPTWLSDAVAGRFPRLIPPAHDWSDPTPHLNRALDALLSGYDAEAQAH